MHGKTYHYHNTLFSPTDISSVFSPADTQNPQRPTGHVVRLCQRVRDRRCKDARRCNPLQAEAKKENSMEIRQSSSGNPRRDDDKYTLVVRGCD